MRDRKASIVAFVLCAALATAAPALEQLAIQNSVTIRLGENGRLPYDPRNHGRVLITFYNAVLGRLIDFTDAHVLIPSLLNTFYWNYESQEYRLELKPGLRFHNGRAVTIEDLEFSLVRFFHTTGRADQVAALKGIVGVNRVRRGSEHRSWSVPGIRRISDRVLAIRLSHPDFTFPYCFRDGWLSLVPKEELTSDYVTWKHFPVGAGPYRVLASTGATEISLEWAWDESFRGKRPSRLVFTTLENREADLVLFSDANPGQLKRESSDAPDSFLGIFFNNRNVLANRLAFRQLISLAFERSALASVLGDGWSPASELLPSSFGGRAKADPVTDIRKARQLFRKMFGSGKTRDLRIGWITGRNPSLEGQSKIASAIGTSLRAIGFNPKFEALDHPTFPPENDDIPMKVDLRGTQVVEPLILFRAYENPGLLSRYFVGREEILSELIREAEAQEIQQKRFEKISEISRYFLRDVLIVPLLERRSSHLLNLKKIESIGIQRGVGFDVMKISMRRINE